MINVEFSLRGVLTDVSELEQCIRSCAKYQHCCVACCKLFIENNGNDDHQSELV
jgi:hypothetical protein